VPANANLTNDDSIYGPSIIVNAPRERAKIVDAVNPDRTRIIRVDY